MEPKHPCVTITGERGSGKTERAIQACDYVRERHHFDAVHWADCHNVVEADAGMSCPTPPPFSADSPGAVDWSADSACDPCRLVSIVVCVSGCRLQSQRVVVKGWLRTLTLQRILQRGHAVPTRAHTCRSIHTEPQKVRSVVSGAYVVPR